MIKQTEVDGVPTLLAPATGQMQAGLAFRVGLSDEKLARLGVTHLVEHLALHSTGVADYHYNGATGTEFTYFHLRGSEADIVAFLNGVCASLRNLPLHRLAIEKEILRTEANGRRGGVTEPLALWRHGARDFGLPGYAELGLHALTADDLQAWVGRYFTRENAALWIAGDSVPAGLELGLPSGVRRPVVPPSSAVAVKPAYFSGSSSAVAWDSLVRREPRAAVFAGVLEREMFRSLRQTGGLSYTVQTDYEPRADGSALITAVADALPEKQEAVLGGFIDVLAATRVGRIEPADVSTVINQRCAALEQAEEHAARLPGQAFNVLTGRPVQSLEEAVAEVRAVTEQDVAAVAVAAWNDGLLMTPRGTSADWAGFTAAPTASDVAVTGTAYPSLEAPGVRLIAGPDGVSVVDQDSQATVRFDALAAMLAWPDGGRHLIGQDAITVRLEPTLFGGSSVAVPWLDGRVAPGDRIDLPAREPDRIPVPATTSPATGATTGPSGARPSSTSAPTGPRRSRTAPVLALVGLIPSLLFFGVIALLMVVSLFIDQTDLGVTIVALVFSAGVAVASVFGVVWAFRRLR